MSAKNTTGSLAGIVLGAVFMVGYQLAAHLGGRYPRLGLFLDRNLWVLCIVWLLLFFIWLAQAWATPSAVNVILALIGSTNVVLYSARWLYVIRQGLNGSKQGERRSND